MTLPNAPASAEWLYTSDESPVQYGSLSQIRTYLRLHLRGKPHEYKAALKDLTEFAKRSTLGTHTEVHSSKRRTGIFHYGTFPHRDEFFETDLMDVFGARGHEDAALQKLNDGYVFLLLVINVGTKFLYAKKLRTKSSGEVANALRDIFIHDVHILSRSKDFCCMVIVAKSSTMIRSRVYCTSPEYDCTARTLITRQLLLSA